MWLNIVTFILRHQRAPHRHNVHHKVKVKYFYLLYRGGGAGCVKGQYNNTFSLSELNH